MKDMSKNNENNRKNAKNTVMDTEIKDKIDFSFVIQDRLFMINKSFDSNDKYRIREA